MKTYSILKVLPGAVFCLCAAVSLAASADRYSETYVSTAAQGLRTVTVSYADLNLTSTAGLETFQRRVSKAARHVCGSANLREAGSLRQVSEIKNCQERAMSEAMSQISSRQLASVAE